MVRKNEKESSWNGWRKTNHKRKRNKGEIDVEGKKKLMSVLFVQHTHKSELAKRLREKLESLEKLGSLKFKVVEKTGNKLEDVLHRSDSWSDRDCGRIDCLICKSVEEDGKRGLCKRRNVVYEVHCITCYEKEKKKQQERELHRNCSGENSKEEEVGCISGKRKRNSENKETDKERREKKTKKEYTVKYVGETGRSAYERGSEHLSDFMNFDEGSHMLKHYLKYHKEMKMTDVKFGMKVRNIFRTALERQVGEAVAIHFEKEKGMIMMNSKSEYNRCTIPRICTKSDKEKKDESDEIVEEDKMMKKEIVAMKNSKGRKRYKTKSEKLCGEKVMMKKRMKYDDEKCENNEKDE